MECKMGTVSLRETNEDMAARVAGQDLRANLVLHAMLAVGHESAGVLTARAESARAAAAEAGDTFIEPRTPAFEYMMLIALRQSGISPQQLLTLHDKVCDSNPTLTAALAADAFASRANNLLDLARRAEAGKPISTGRAMLALQNLRAIYGTFDSSTAPTEIVPLRPAQALEGIEAERPRFGHVTGRWGKVSQPRATETGPTPRKKQPGETLAAM
jgi:hypothetical protein